MVLQLQRAGRWLRDLPARLRQPADPGDTAASLRAAPEPPLRAWDRPEDSSPEIVVDPPADPGKTMPTPAVTARPLQQLGALGRQLSPRAREFGRKLGDELAPKAAALGRRVGRQIAPLARRGAQATGRGLLAGLRRLADLRPLLGLLGRGFAGIGGLTVRLLGGLVRGLAALSARITTGFERHRGLLLAFLQRAAWWAALALLLVGGQALLGADGQVPFGPAALPLFGLGLGLCAVLLLIAAQARLRWAAFALGLGHGGLLTLVWAVTTA